MRSASNGGDCGSAATSPGSAPAATRLFTERTVIINCLGRAEMKPGSFGNPGTLRYTKITLIYTGSRPKVLGGYPATVTETLWA